MEKGIEKIPQAFIKSRILSYSLESLVRFAEERSLSYPPDTSKEEFVDLILQRSPEIASELYDASEIKRSLSRELLLEKAPEAVGEAEATREDLVLDLMKDERRRILEDVQLLMAQERAKTFRRYLLARGRLVTDASTLLDSASASFDNLRDEIETRMSVPGKLATLERVLERDDSLLFFIKYVDKIRYAEEMEGRHWDTLIRRVVAVLHQSARTLEIGTPDPNREARTVSTLSSFLTGEEDAFTGWPISTPKILASLSDPEWNSDAGGSGPVGVSYVDFTNLDLQGRPQKISLLGDDVLLTLRALSRGGLDLSKIGSLHKVRFVFKGRKVDLFPEEAKFIFLAYMDEKQRRSFYDWISAMRWA